MLDPNLLAQLEGHFAKISTPVELVARFDETARSTDLRSLLDQIASTSDLVEVVEDDTAPDRTPSFAVRRSGTDVEVAFAGLPVGHELTSLVLAILQVGGHPSTAADEVLDQVRAIDTDLVFETYFSTTCQNCPDVVQALNSMSVVNPRIRHIAIDGAAFQHEVDERHVMAVPTVFCNGELFDQGRMTLDQIVARLDSGAAERRARELEAMEPFDVLIVGGGPAGAAAAIYAARKGIRTGLLAERLGGQVLDTMSIENFVSVPATDGPALAAALQRHVKEHDVEVIDLQRATRLEPAAGPGGLARVVLDSGATLEARTVILSTGARWRQLGVPGEAEHRNKGVTYCPHCDGPLFKGKRVAVIGGGNSGVEAAIDLAGVVSRVTLLEFDERLRADDVLQRKLNSLPNAEVILGARTTGVVGDGTAVTGLAYEAVGSGEPRDLGVEGVFVQIGLLPNTEWLDGAIDLTERGEIVIDEHGRTSAPGVFAAGDCTTVPFKQIVVAMGAGSTAALSAFEHLIRTSAPSGAAADPAALATAG
ncbi:MAG TPA: alkyl hydroperoxide reductase subunit F [Acidimicrobiales bacterium]|nr:alkyl hydroperoxide reductase subunit F [Acidimicrobiales bacterium]